MRLTQFHSFRYTWHRNVAHEVRANHAVTWKKGRDFSKHGQIGEMNFGNGVLFFVVFLLFRECECVQVKGNTVGEDMND